MNSRAVQQLHELARIHGLQTSYQDMQGRQQTAAPEVLTALLRALTIPARTPAEISESLHHAESHRCSQGVEPVTVVWDGEPARIRFHPPAQFAGKSVSLHLLLENGERRTCSARCRIRRDISCPIDIKRSFGELILPRLAFGYHTAEIEIGSATYRTRIISAPMKSYSEPHLHDWGVFLPVYSAHSAQSWGAGNLSDWRQVCDWTASLGGHVSATLPLLAAFLDYPTCDPSPYSPASRLFWNEFHLDITQVPEFAHCPAAKKLFGSGSFQKRLRAVRKSSLVDYRTEWALRRRILEPLAQFFFERDSPRRSSFEQFLRLRPEAIDYARFRAMCDRTKTSWRHWPQRLHEGNLRPEDSDQTLERFHLYIQWLAQEQIDKLVTHCRERGVKLYLDLPLGVHPDGYDVWRWPDNFAREVSVGAPPDAFFTKGQNWGFAPLHPQRLPEQGYRYVLEFLRFQMRHTGLLRIDHVMGLHRLYCIPNGFPATHGAYLRYPAEELHAIFSLESHRHRTMLVGENLGTVPPEVNADMERHGLRKMFVLPFEQRPDPPSALPSPPRHSVVSINTHDLPTFSAHWHGSDLNDRAQLGLISKAELREEREGRKKLNSTLAAFLKHNRVLKDKETDVANVLEACLAWLGGSQAELVLVNLEDLLLEEQPQNVPGTSTERPNWRRKTKLPLKKIFRDRKARQILRELNRQRRQSPPGASEFLLETELKSRRADGN